MILKSLHIDCAVIELLEGGIIRLQYKPDFEIELKHAREVEKAMISIAESRDIYCLMDWLGQYNNFTNEAQKFLSKEASIVQNGQMKCTAVIIDNLPNRILTKFFSKFFKPKFVVKIFSNKEDALAWLKLKMKEAPIQINQDQGFP